MRYRRSGDDLPGLYRHRNRSSSRFSARAVVGSVIEYLLSWGQETLRLSPELPDYSRMPFNLDGRICLLSTRSGAFWASCGSKPLSPGRFQVILKIPNRFGKVLTWVLTIFMVFDCAMSLLAVDRWSERVCGDPRLPPWMCF